MPPPRRALRPGIEVIGVQTERFPAAWNAKHGGQRENAQATIADGIAVASPGALALPLIRRHVDDVLLAEIIERGMVKSGRLARLRFDVRDVPGALADVATLLGRLGANIDEVQHQRAFISLSAWGSGCCLSGDSMDHSIALGFHTDQMLVRLP